MAEQTPMPERGATRCLQYFAFLRDPEFVQAGRGSHRASGGSSLPAPSTPRVGAAAMTHCLRKLEEKRDCLEAHTLADAGARGSLCAECAKNGQKSTCPQRKLVRFRNGTRVVQRFNGVPQCPTSSTRWWVF